ncbi:hypothetical protein RKD30_007015 [Streptomyces pristinaespiralis]
MGSPAPVVRGFGFQEETERIRGLLERLAPGSPR